MSIDMKSNAHKWDNWTIRDLDIYHCADCGKLIIYELGRQYKAYEVKYQDTVLVRQPKNSICVPRDGVMDSSDPPRIYPEAPKQVYDDRPIGGLHDD